MALLKLDNTVGSIRKSIAGTTFRKTSNGSIASSKRTLIKRRTQKQHAVRIAFRKAVRKYHDKALAGESFADVDVAFPNSTCLRTSAIRLYWYQFFNALVD